MVSNVYIFGTLANPSSYACMYQIIISDDMIMEKIVFILYVIFLSIYLYSYLEARSMKRHVIYHAGPTNSGKTYHALQSYMKAESGIYCGPLRMLAGEIYRKSNEEVYNNTYIIYISCIESNSLLFQL